MLFETLCIFLGASDTMRSLHIKNEGRRKGCATVCEYGQEHCRVGASVGGTLPESD